VCVCVCQYADDVEDDEFARTRLHRAGKKKSAKKTITQVTVNTQSAQETLCLINVLRFWPGMFMRPSLRLEANVRPMNVAIMD